VYARKRESRGWIDAQNARMSVGRAKKGRVQGPGQTDVIDEFAAPAQKSRVFRAQDSRADGPTAHGIRPDLREPSIRCTETAMAIEAANALERTLLRGDAVEVGPDGRATLMGGVCSDCGAETFPRAPVCSTCMSENIAPKAMPRRGTLYAFSTVHVAAKKWKKPMCVGYVDLPNKARVFTHLVGGNLAIGDEVEVAMGTVGEDENGPIDCFVFRKVSP
jgi:uncharacterized OB-fold protein